MRQHIFKVLKDTQSRRAKLNYRWKPDNSTESAAEDDSSGQPAQTRRHANGLETAIRIQSILTNNHDITPTFYFAVTVRQCLLRSAALRPALVGCPQMSYSSSCLLCSFSGFCALSFPSLWHGPHASTVACGHSRSITARPWRRKCLPVHAPPPSLLLAIFIFFTARGAPGISCSPVILYLAFVVLQLYLSRFLPLPHARYLPLQFSFSPDVPRIKLHAFPVFYLRLPARPGLICPSLIPQTLIIAMLRSILIFVIRALIERYGFLFPVTVFAPVPGQEQALY